MMWLTLASLSDVLRRHLVEREVFGQELWRCLAALGLLILGFLAAKIVSAIIIRWGRGVFKKLDEENADKAAKAIAQPVGFGVTVLGIWLAVDVLRVPEEFEDIITKGLKFLVVMVVAYGVLRLIDLLDAFLKHLVARTETKLDDMLLPVVRKSLKVLVVIIGAMTALQNMGFNVTTLLAGLGIGSLAVAFAAKDTLANIFGSIMIFTDQPFKIGERIKISGVDGVVEEVGIRSTRIRTLDGHLVTIPNGEVANANIENVGRRPTIKRLFKIGVTYDTGYEKVQRAIEIIKEILDQAEGLEELKVVRFIEFADCSLNILVLYWVSEPDYLGKFLPIGEGINLEILRRFDAEGIEIAFPTSTVHLFDDTPKEVREGRA